MLNKDSVRSSALLKMFVIGFLALLLLIPTAMISELIRERSQRQQEAMQEVREKWGGQQIVSGPILTIPYTAKRQVVTNTNDGQVLTQEIEEKKYVSFLPEQLNFKGDVGTQLLKRGIYEVSVYDSQLEIGGYFVQPDFSLSEMPTENAQINWEEAYISFSLSDLKALQKNSKFSWDKKEYEFKPGYENKAAEAILAYSGINAKVDVSADAGPGRYDFSFTLDIKGSESLQFAPVGKETNVNLSSDWPAPSFIGSFLPDKRELDENGFTADWRVLELNRDYPQVWDQGYSNNIHKSSLGVKFIITVDEYQKNTRAVKYAIMFISLTFLVFFFVEIINRVRIHPIQYILVGLSLVLFFSLLISITEHLNFNLAYLISALATITLVALYARTIFKSLRLTGVLTGILFIIYIFIFTIIQLEDYSLLFGSVGLFLVLALVMYISRKIDWYSAGFKKD